MRLWFLCLYLLIGLVTGHPVQSESDAPQGRPDTTETRLFHSLNPSGQRGVIHRALKLGHGSMYRHNERTTESEMELNIGMDPSVERLVRRMNLYIREMWELTPEQMDQLAETGRLCNEKGECLDVNDDIGVNCCPFG